jgi:zinc D-Ala-D-Ala carboxypeptidase
VAFYEEENWPKDRWPNFSIKELQCSHTGLCNIDEDMMDKLQGLRNEVGTSLVITSGYRDATHPVEAGKSAPGTGSHCQGKAIDIRCSGATAFMVVEKAISLGFTGIGISQQGNLNSRFIHLDTLDDTGLVPRPTIWSY